MKKILAYTLMTLIALAPYTFAKVEHVRKNLRDNTTKTKVQAAAAKIDYETLEKEGKTYVQADLKNNYHQANKQK